MKNGSKNQRKVNLRCFNPVAWVCVIAMVPRLYFYDNFFQRFFICLSPFFREFFS